MACFGLGMDFADARVMRGPTVLFLRVAAYLAAATAQKVGRIHKGTLLQLHGLLCVPKAAGQFSFFVVTLMGLVSLIPPIAKPRGMHHPPNPRICDCSWAVAGCYFEFSGDSGAVLDFLMDPTGSHVSHISAAPTATPHPHPKCLNLRHDCTAIDSRMSVPVISCYLIVMLQVSGDNGDVLDFLMDPTGSNASHISAAPTAPPPPTKPHT
jgi:hypothetical protein